MHVSSIAQLLLIGLIAALGPLAYVWARHGARGAGARKLVWVITFLTFDLILFGAFTRLTDSGLGCPDWPGCYGTSNPLAAHASIKEAEAAMPTGPVTVAKAWIEMLHRYLAMGVGVLIMALVAVSWVRRHEAPRVLPAALGLFVLVCIQGAFGAWTVTMKLMPLVVTVHLLLAITLLCALGSLAAREWPGAGAAMHGDAGIRLRPWVTLGLMVVFLQIALGGWVSTNYAVLACPDFPLCHGAVFPAQADFASGFQLLRPLGVLADGKHLPVEALVAIHWVHRAFALVVLAIVVAVSLKVLRHLRRDTRAAGLARMLLALLVLQVLTGISNVIFEWPLVVAVTHNGGAAALALTLTLLRTHLASQTAPAFVPVVAEAA